MCAKHVKKANTTMKQHKLFALDAFPANTTIKPVDLPAKIACLEQLVVPQRRVAKHVKQANTTTIPAVPVASDAFPANTTIKPVNLPVKIARLEKFRRTDNRRFVTIVRPGLLQKIQRRLPV